MRGSSLVAVAVCAASCAVEAHAGEPTAIVSARGGVYSDSDRTTVFRTNASARKTFGPWSLGVDEAVDIVTSASTDVRTSGAVDVTTGASARAPRMHDRRFQTNLSFGWNDGVGHTATASAFAAFERDYRSLGGAVRGTFDLFERNTTVIGALNTSFDEVTSVLDPTFSAHSSGAGYALGVAQLLGRRSALRARYDGSYRSGYLASPYRSVRFGNWTTEVTPEGYTTFVHTIGPSAGVPEKLPDTRVRHAITLEVLHELLPRLGTLVSYRFGIDSWNVQSHTIAPELRFLLYDGAVARLVYRFYQQRGADLFRGKYVLDPGAYAYFTSDKELGDMYGHEVGIGVRFARGKNEPDTRSFDANLHWTRYQYPGFALLDARSAIILDLGGTLDL
jgi:hypothetical protein